LISLSLSLSLRSVANLSALFWGLGNYIKYTRRYGGGGHFQVLNRISCFLSLAGNSCLASPQGFHMRRLSELKYKIMEKGGKHDDKI
jgi:hypothetical protein